jgi:AcrR family transcriptional regulator
MNLACAPCSATSRAAGLTMEAVAAAAQVGKGTVFRRFRDRTGLLMALLDHSERKFQAALLTGPPPLGPGAPPVERLRAFGRAWLRRAAEDLELQLAAEPSGGTPHHRGASCAAMSPCCCGRRSRTRTASCSPTP